MDNQCEGYLFETNGGYICSKCNNYHCPRCNKILLTPTIDDAYLYCYDCNKHYDYIPAAATIELLNGTRIKLGTIGGLINKDTATFVVANYVVIYLEEYIDVSDLLTEWYADTMNINSNDILNAAIERINKQCPDGYRFGTGDTNAYDYGFWPIKEKAITEEFISDSVIRLTTNHCTNKPVADKIQICYSYSYGGIMYLVYGVEDISQADDILAKYIGV